MSSSSLNPGERSRRLTLVLEQILSRRANGEQIPDAEAIRQWPELMPELREHLDALGRIELAAGVQHAPTRSLPERGAAEPNLDLAHVALGDALRGYRILGEIHRGGQGVVYEALQLSTSRKVAIKVTREGPFSAASEVQRFEREARILAQIRHPNIVAIHDCGIAAGCFYFVMDRILGERLDAFVQQAALEVNASLRLFGKVCEAVNAAHLLGVIHRDLKPGNILVDERGEPHVLDFGLAKVTGAIAGEGGAPSEVMTMTGQFVGSLPWASPEQALGFPLGVDTRTDVYSLGVIFYQMLTGRFPYQVVGSMRDVLDNIQRHEAVAPSRIAPSVNSEVETIVLKCLQKERERRYQTAGELARDIQRYLAGDAIEAKRDSLVYVLTKQLRRHKLPVALGAAVFGISVIGFATSLSFWRQAAAERDEAKLARTREQTQRAIAETARAAADDARAAAETQKQVALQKADEARRSATEVQAVNHFLRTILASGSPTELGGKGTIREALGRAEQQITSGALGNQPEALASAREALGVTYRELGLFELAEPHLRAALELKRSFLPEDDPQVGNAAHHLAWLLIDLRKLDEAESLSRQALATFERAFGADSLPVADELNSLGQIHSTRGDDFHAIGFYERAVTIYRAAAGDQRRWLATLLNNLGLSSDAIGKSVEAERYHREALALRREALPADHLDIAQSLHNLGAMIEDRGAEEESVELLRESLRIREIGYGAEHPELALTHGALGGILTDMRRFEEAEPHLLESLRQQRQLLPGSPQVGIALDKLGRLASARGDQRGAIAFMSEAIETLRSTLGPDHPDLATSISNLGSLHYFLEEYDEAERHYRDALRIYRLSPENMGPSVASTLGNLAAIRLREEDYVGAEAGYREAMELSAKLHGPRHANVARSMHYVAESLRSRGCYGEAEPVFAEALAMRRELLPPGHRDLALTQAYLGLTRLELGCTDEAEADLRAAIELWAAAGVQNWQVNRALVARGKALLALGRVAEAHEALMDAYERLTDDPASSAALYERYWECLGEVYEIEAVSTP